jgi:hypothetical protein
MLMWHAHNSILYVIRSRAPLSLKLAVHEFARYFIRSEDTNASSTTVEMGSLTLETTSLAVKEYSSGDAK